MSAPVIHFDYDFSPYGQKTKLLLAATGIEHTKCDVPAVLPRPELEALDITYRRIPLLAVGKDVYADSSLIIDVISKLGKIQESPADKAWETWSNVAFAEALGLIPPAVLSPEFVKDRKTIFPALSRPDILELRPSALAALRERLNFIEKKVLSGSGPLIGGSKPALADIHIFWVIRWLFSNLEISKESGFGKDAYPKIYKAIESLPPADPKVTSAEETHKIIKGAQYTAPEIGVAKDDPTGFSAGAAANVESLDAEPGSHPQKGKLVGLNDDEIVLELKDGVRLHFPRIGYVLKKA